MTLNLKFGLSGARTNSTRIAHAVSTADCVVAGSSRIAASASKPADSACAACTSAPQEPDASKESTPDAVTRGIFGGGAKRAAAADISNNTDISNK